MAIIPFFSESPFTRRLTKQLLTRILTGPSLVIEYCQEQSHSLWREISFPDNLSMRSKYIRQTLRAKFAGHPGREEAVFRTLWNFQAPSIIYPESTLFLSPSFLLKHLKAISGRVPATRDLVQSEVFEKVASRGIKALQKRSENREDNGTCCCRFPVTPFM